MTEVGPNFILTCIPKTGTNSARETLRLNFDTFVREPYHGPPAIVDRPIVVAFVRHPAFWLRSYWCNREDNNWALGGGTGLWHEITEWLNPFRRDDCTEFILTIGRERPGIVGDFFNQFLLPETVVGKSETLYADLKWFIPGITRCAPSSNVRPNKPYIGLGAIKYIESKEPWLMNTFYKECE